jgi:hypothetical protein
MATLTMLEAAKVMSGEVKRQAVVEMFAAESDILRVLPFTDIPGGSYTYTQEGTLPGVAFRNIGGSYTPGAGVLNPYTEQFKIMGGEIDVDRASVRINGIGVRSVHERMKIKKMASNFTLKFIKGDSTSTAAEFDGLQRRLTGNQLIEAGSTDGGDALSLLKLDEAIDAVDDPTHLFMSKAMARRLNAAARTTAVGGYMTYSRDEFGRPIRTYNDLPILIADRNSYADAVLAFDEVGSGGATATATSIYALSLGEGMLTGLQNEAGMEVIDLGEIDASPVMRTRIEWICSIAPVHGRSAARLRGISDAPVVA